MKRWGRRLVASGVMVLASSVRADAPPSLLPIHHVVVWVQGSDASISEKIEFALLDRLADRHVAGTRFVQLFPDGSNIPSRQKIATLRAGGYDSLLFLQRESAIHWDNHLSTSTADTSLRAFLRKNAPADEPADVVIDSGTTKTIEVASATGSWDIVKGRAVLFDINQENIVWVERTQMKTSTGLPTSLYVSSIAKSLIADLTEAKLIPPGK